MFKYFAISWNPREKHDAARAAGIAARIETNSHQWHRAIRVKGLQVYISAASNESTTAYRLPGGSGVVLGKCFLNSVEGDQPPATPEFSNQMAREVIRTQGRHLIDKVWGRYVAFLHDASCDTTWVLRDPTGGLPCYVTQFDGLTIFFSYIEDCIALGINCFSVNWKFVAAFACNPFFKSSMTGLHEVSELQPGECIELRGGVSRTHVYWHPSKIVRARTIESVDDAVNKTRSTTKACVSAWASCYSSIIQMLSGGLDSSIVLYCLRTARADARVTCVNYVTPGDGDERRYARLVAESLKCDLIEHDGINSEIRLERLLNIVHFPSPRSFHYELRNGEFESELTSRFGAKALFTGGGGDHCFFQSPMVMSAIDYIYRHGARPDLLRIINRISIAERRSIWSVLLEIARIGRYRNRWMPFRDTNSSTSILNPETLHMIANDEGLTHQWLASDDVSYAKKNHIAYLLTVMEASTFYYPFPASGDHPDNILPLISQPLVELCLQIPLYIHSAGGWDRSIERRAFQRELPSTIALRRDKSFITGSLAQITSQEMKFIRELMMDGYLVRNGIVDRCKLERTLSDDCQSFMATENAIQNRAAIVVFYLSVEAWIRSWLSQGELSIGDAAKCHATEAHRSDNVAVAGVSI